MKIIKWIASNKIVILMPLLAFICVSVFVFAQNRVQAQKTIQAATQSDPAPKIKTADEPGTENKLAATQATQPSGKSEITSDTSKVVFQVDNMSCSGCISTIKSSLTGYEGIQDIIVDISGGVAEVYYDRRKIKDVDRMASSITASGYPARVNQIFTADQIRKEEALAASRAKFYIASVGGWDISRTDFNTELAFAKKGYQKAYGENVFTGDKGKTVLDGIKAEIVSRLINEGIQMQEVQRVGYRVDPKTVDREFEKFLTQKELDLEGLKATLEKSGYPFDYFMKKFENRVLLNRYLDEKVLGAAASDYDKQNQYQAWFNTARVLSKVTIYDQELKRVSQNQSVGGGCGQSSGASCCSTKKS
jgi:copper chaperone CopZ